MTSSALRTIVAHLLPLILLAACAKEPPKPIPPVVVFPPQKAMESGDYASFLEENRKALEDCTAENAQCDVALFNVAFVYAYPESPFYNEAEGLSRLKEVTGKYPQSPWAFQAKTMAAIMEKKIVEEEKRRQLKSRLKSKDTTIQKLKKQIKRSREIDLEMDRKERELLQ